MMCTAGRMLQEKLDVFQLTFYTAPVSLAVLFPFFITREASPSPPDWPVMRSTLQEHSRRTCLQHEREAPSWAAMSAIVPDILPQLHVPDASTIPSCSLPPSWASTQQRASTPSHEKRCAGR